MTISAKDWAMYVARLSRLGKTAESMMKEYIAEHGSEDIKDITEFAFGLVTKYGEGAASLACEMYEALAKAQGAKVPAASPAYTARLWETKVAMKGTTDAEKPAAVSRLVKRAGADTTMQNAIRDGAQFAWIPSGDSCPFCIALAARGWQYASKKSIKNGHAEHIHANCDCQYAVRFDQNSTVQGYDPDKHREMYYSAEGSTPQEKINSMRREMTAKQKVYKEPLFDAIIHQAEEYYSPEQIKQIAAETRKIADKYIPSIKSRWNGSVIIDNDLNPAKLYDCSIRTGNNTAPHILLHEQLHAKSISIYGEIQARIVYAAHSIIEESSVQYLCQEISKIENIPIIKSVYDKKVEVLRQIRYIVAPEESDLFFAQKVLEQPLEDRVEWLRSLAAKLSLETNMTVGDYLEQLEG